MVDEREPAVVLSKPTQAVVGRSGDGNLRLPVGDEHPVERLGRDLARVDLLEAGDLDPPFPVYRSDIKGQVTVPRAGQDLANFSVYSRCPLGSSTLGLKRVVQAALQ